MNIKTANRLCELRKEKNLSQEELALKIGVSRQTISKWERSEASPDTDNLIALAKLYNLSLDELLSVDDIQDEDLEQEEKEEKDNLKIRIDNGKGKVVEIFDNDDDDDDFEEIIEKKGHVHWWDGLLLFATLIAFFLLGFLASAWSWCWLVFLLWISLESLISAIESRDAEDFAYPVFIVMVYLFIGIKFGMWHPHWVLFLTIPVFYSVAGGIRHNRKNKK